MKVLIISHNCFSSTQSMGKTLASLFSSFRKDELAQLYFYPSVPNVDICGSFFRITDKDVINAIVRRRNCGRIINSDEISPSNTLFENPDEEQQYTGINRNSLLIRRIRDIVWHVGHWKTSALKQWLKSCKPDVIFYALGDATFSQNVARWAADYLNVPLVTYVCDEFYLFYKNHINLTTRLLYVSLVLCIAKTIKKSSHIISICDELGKTYQKLFGTSYTTVMTGSSFLAGSLELRIKKKQLSYIGNLGLNRWKNLLDISNAVSKINNEYREEYKLVYYGAENSHLKGIIEYGGCLDQAQVKQAMAESKLLVHTETFDADYLPRLRYSISTKIADSLASGTCLFAYGPDALASIQYLTKNECAIVASKKEELYPKLLSGLHDNSLNKRLVMNAEKTACLFHDADSNSAALRKALNILNQIR